MTSETMELPHMSDTETKTSEILATGDVLAPHAGRDTEVSSMPISEALRRALAARQPIRGIWRLRSPAARADARRWRRQDLAMIRHLIRLARAGAKTARVLWVE